MSTLPIESTTTAPMDIVISGFCTDQFWNDTLSWNAAKPALTQCFQETVISYIPVVFLLLSIPLEILYNKKRCNPRIFWNLRNVSRILIVILCILFHIKDISLHFVNETNSKSAFVSNVVKAITFIIFLLHLRYQKCNGVHASPVSWLFSLLILICNIPKFLDIFVVNELVANEDIYFHIIYFVIVLVLFFLCSLSDINEKVYHTTDDKTAIKKPICPQLFASFPSKFTFWWINKLSFTGYRRALLLDDLWELRDEDKSVNCARLLEDNIKRNVNVDSIDVSYEKLESQTVIELQSNLKCKISLWKAIVKAFGVNFFAFFMLKIMSDILQVTNPLVLKKLIHFTSSGEEEVEWHGLFYAFMMFTITLVQSLLSNYFFYNSYTIGLKMKSALIAIIFKKSLKLNNESRNSATTGEIVNLMSVDAQRCQDFMQYCGYLFAAPFQIIMITTLLFFELGFATFAGILVMALLVPINVVIGIKMKKFQGKQMKQKDERIKALSEILNGIKILKLYAWEKSFINNILGLRKKEVKLLRSIGYLNSATIFLFSCAPFVVSFTTFVVYVLIDSNNIMTPEKVFVSLAYFSALRVPLTLLPSTFSYLIMTLVSVKRIDKFIKLGELDDYVTRNDEEDAISVENSSFSWSESDSSKHLQNGHVSELKNFETCTLTDININVAKGSLVAIVGNVGSGKSSLLSALLGEMNQTKGRVNINGKMTIAYVAQQAWIENLTLKENILFGQPFEYRKYKRILRACALEADLKMLQQGDETEIGEKGINLSGGQKQRVSLARACYSEADIFLFDDPLSAVDAYVGKHIFDKVLSSKSGILKNKTRVLVTNSIDLLPNVDEIIVLKDGRISEKGTFQDLVQSKREFSEFISRHSSKNMQNNEKGIEKSTEDELSRQLSVIKDQEKENEKVKSKLIEDEFAEKGNVKLLVYKYYIKSMTYLWVILCLSSYAGAQVSAAGTNVWLSFWSNDNVTGEPDIDDPQRNYRLIFYAVLGFAQVSLILMGALALVRGTTRAAVSIHENMLWRVMRSPMSFFETTPIGRIVNRFGKDIDVIDATLPTIISNWMICFFEVLATIVLIETQTPLFVIAFIPIAITFYFCQKLYVASSRQLKRLESVTRSPIYSHFGAALSGVSTIRAYNAEKRFINESYSRVDINQSCYYPSVVANRWIGVRLEICSNFITLFAGIFAVLSRNSLSGGAIGLSITYALNTTQMLNWLVRITSDMETQVTSIERIEEYSKLPSEDDWEKSGTALPKDWPKEGTIRFENYNTRYREGLDLVLKDINAIVESSEKIGIVGRTGAGKSTITLALFRLIEAASGRIFIDDHDISKLALHDLRSRITIIPQDPVLFSGSLRMNLDPFNNFSDDQIWRALENSFLKSFVSTVEKGLNHEIVEGGANLSVGQRQLVCLARALLRKTKILILDEATAAIDMETDSLIQTAIRSEFKQCTILTIAHRLNTVIDSDRIVVLDKGHISEFDSPSILLAKEDSLLRSLAKDAGIV